MIRGIEKIEFGLPGDGVAGDLTEEFTKFKVSSMVFKDPKYGTENIPAENDPNFLTVGTDGEPSTVGGELYEVPINKLPMLTGGTYDSDNGGYAPPSSATDVYLTVKVTSVATRGKKMEITFPFAKITAWREGTMTANELVTLHFEAVANTPVSSEGEKGKLSITREISA